MSPRAIEFTSWGLVILVFAFAVVALFKLWRMDLSGLIQEAVGGKASLSRFQALIFTFVIAGLYIVLALDTGDFIAIPESVLGLLGISGGTYLISKGISAGREAGANGIPSGGSSPPASTPPIGGAQKP